MKQTKYPAGWNERKIRRVLRHYEFQTEDEAIREDEAAAELKGQTLIVVPKKLVPEITRLIEKRRSRSNRVS
jgi:galactitol-specific phosphotransferase system IIB component